MTPDGIVAGNIPMSIFARAWARNASKFESVIVAASPGRSRKTSAGIEIARTTIDCEILRNSVVYDDAHHERPVFANEPYSACAEPHASSSAHANVFCIRLPDGSFARAVPNRYLRALTRMIGQVVPQSRGASAYLQLSR